MPATDSYLCLRLLTESTGQFFWLFLKRRCLLELFISKPPVRLSMLNEIKKIIVVGKKNSMLQAQKKK